MNGTHREVPELAEFDIRNKNGTLKSKAEGGAQGSCRFAVVPEIYKDEYDADSIRGKIREKDEADKAWKSPQSPGREVKRNTAN